jgi:hypothetical protein
MRALLFLLVELAAIAVIAVGVALEFGAGWGLIAVGAGVLVESLAAQKPVG